MKKIHSYVKLNRIRAVLGLSLAALLMLEGTYFSKETYKYFYLVNLVMMLSVEIVDLISLKRNTVK